MNRIVAVTVLLLGTIAVASGRSQAQEIVVRGHTCFVLPNYVPTPCPPTPAPTAPPIPPNKQLSVSGGRPLPLGLTEYTVNITSQVVCFPLTEPINVYTLGNPGSAALRPATPGTIPLQNPNKYQVTVDKTGHAVLSLEILNRQVGVEGLAVKAVWPLEGVERLVPVAPGATLTPLPTGQPTSVPTASSTATPIATSTAVVTGTPGTPVAPPVPTTTPQSTPFFVRVCVTPNPVAPGANASVYVQTLPTATCSASVVFSNGTTVPSLQGAAQTVGDFGVAGFTFPTDKNAAFGTATVTCTYGDLTASDSVEFNIAAR